MLNEIAWFDERCSTELMNDGSKLLGDGSFRKMLTYKSEGERLVQQDQLLSIDSSLDAIGGGC